MKIRLVNNTLTFQKGSQIIYNLKPMEEDIFLVESMAYMRVKFIKNNGAVTSMIRVYDNGMERKTTKAN